MIGKNFLIRKIILLNYLACENCDNWFHPKCVGVSRTANLDKLVWYCSNCSSVKKPLNTISENVKRRNEYEDVEKEVFQNTRRKRIKG